MARSLWVWTTAILVLIRLSAAPAVAGYAEWANAAEKGAFWLEWWTAVGPPGPAGPPVPHSTPDSVDNYTEPGSGLVAADWYGGIGLTLRLGESLGFPKAIPPGWPLLHDAVGNYSVDDSIELGLPIWGAGFGLDGVFPTSCTAYGCTGTHGAARPLDLLFLWNSTGVGKDGTSSNQRAWFQWWEMKASCYSGHESVGASPYKDFDGYCDRAALIDLWNGDNTAWGAGQLALWGHALSQIDPVFLRSSIPLGNYIDVALNSLAASPPSCDPLYYWAVGLGIREFIRERDWGDAYDWVNLLTAAQQPDGGFYNPACPGSLCDRVLNTAGAMIGLDAEGEWGGWVWGDYLRPAADFLVANQIPGPATGTGYWCGDSRDYWPTYALFKFFEDNTVPYVNILTPRANEVICSDAAWVEVEADDNFGIERVEFSVDTQVPFATDADWPFRVSLDTSGLLSGDHTIKAKAYDYASTYAEATVAVRVDKDDPYGLIVNPPLDYTIVSGTQSPVMVLANDITSGVEKVVFFVDSSRVGEDATYPYEVSWDTTMYSDCTHTLSAQILDKCSYGGHVTTLTRPVVISNTPPTVNLTSPLGACLQEDETFVVSVQEAPPTGCPGSCSGICQVHFDLGSLSYDTQVASPTPGCTTQSFTWGGVNTRSLPDGPVTLHFWAKDCIGSQSLTGYQDYLVNNRGPTAAITVPTEGSVVRGSCSVYATATDLDCGVEKVEFWLDVVGAGTLIGTDTTSPYGALWDTTKVADGAHTIIAHASDDSVAACGCPWHTRGNSAPVNVTVDNDWPTVSITEIAPFGAPPLANPSCGTVTIKASASDLGSGILAVYFYVDGTTPDKCIGSATTAPYQVPWNTTLASDGSHTLYASAVDKIWRTTTTAGLVVNVDNTTLPTVAWTSPVDTEPVHGTKALTATAWSPGGIAKVEFFVGATKIDEDTSSPYSIPWDTTGTADCTHTLKALATDLCGKTTDKTITVFVDNTPPVITITSPTCGSTVRGAVCPEGLAVVPITVSATDVHAAAGTQMYVRVRHVSPGPPYWITEFTPWTVPPMPDGLGPITVNWQTKASDNGHTEIWVTADDGLSNMTPTAKICPIVVNNASFEDVPWDYWAWLYIERLCVQSITAGCAATPEKLFCPSAPVSRAQMAVFICRALGQRPASPTTPTFSDVPRTYWAYGYIERFYALGITSGCLYDPITGDRRYCPDALVTRAQMAVFILRSLHVPGVNQCTGMFSDVPSGSFACQEIEKFHALGITSGCTCGPGSPAGAICYCPDRPVRRDEMAVFLVRAFGIGPPP